MKKIVIAFLIICLAAFLALYISTSSHAIPANRILVSGNIEVTEVEISFELAGRVAERLVDEGEFITEGQLVASLDPSPWLQEVESRKALVQKAAANLDELKNGYLPEEVAQAQAQKEQAKADFDRLEADFKRQQTLFSQKVISQREYEAAISAYEVAKARYAETSDRLSYFERGIRSEKIDQAQASVSEAEHNLALAQIKLGYAVLKSPIQGLVLSKNIEPGEYVGPGVPIITVGNFVETWLRAYVNETDLGKVKLGQAVEIFTDTFPDKKYEGRISFISSKAEFTPKTVQTEQERVKLVYRIKIDIQNPDYELKPGMPADGFIILEP